MQKQVEKSHYKFKKYCSEKRWASYYFQLKETLSLNPSSILEVGVGDKVFANYIKSNTSIEYRSLDIDPDLGPDIVGSVDKIPMQNKSVDIACAFEVLEHLPFSQFSSALQELSRISKKAVVLSLPHHATNLKLSIKVPFIKELQWLVKVPRNDKHVFDGQHYWEIGKRGFSLKRVLNEINNFYICHKHFAPFTSQNHHFFILEPK